MSLLDRILDGDYNDQPTDMLDRLRKIANATGWSADEKDEMARLALAPERQIGTHPDPRHWEKHSTPAEKARAKHLRGDEDADAPPSSLIWADLTATDDEPNETPGLVPAGDGHVFYLGRHNDVHGPPGGGKTWILYSAYAHALEAGHSILAIDYEDSPRTFRARLGALGVSADVIADPSRVRYVNVPARLGIDEVHDIDQAITALSTDRRHVVVGIDAMADALANDGADESSNTDVTRWHRRIVAFLLRVGCTVITLDHIAKAVDRASNGARGAGAKLALLDGVCYELKLLEGFAIGRAGKIALHIVKDRHGAIGPPRTHAFTAHITPGADGHLSIRWELASTEDRAPFRPTGYMEKVSRWIAATEGRPSQRQVTEAVPGGTNYIRDALAHLVSEGYLKLTIGARNARLYEHLKDYREAADPLTAPPRLDRASTAPETRCDDRATAPPPLTSGGAVRGALREETEDDRASEPQASLLDLGADR